MSGDPAPVVLIEGWAAGTSPAIFNGLDRLLNDGRPKGMPLRRLLVVKCGSFSSLYDRSVEIYYALKGGRTDYGEEHSKIQGHARYGHSFGGSTICALQKLLADNAIPGADVGDQGASMMKSVVSISSPHRGTPLAKVMGQLDGIEAGQKRFSIGWALALSVHIFQSLNTDFIKKDIYDFGGDHWWMQDTAEAEKSKKLGLIQSFYNYFAGKSIGLSADSAGYNMLMEQMAIELNGFKLCHDTYYRSFTATCQPTLALSPLTYLSNSIRYYPHEYSDDPEWQANDLFVPLASQQHPHACSSTTCLHLPSDLANGMEPPPLPGCWHVKHHNDTTHFGLVNYLWRAIPERISDKTQVFWQDLGQWLDKVDIVAELNEPLREYGGIGYSEVELPMVEIAES